MRLSLLTLLALCALTVNRINAQDWRTCSVETFRAKLCHLVSQGNLQYDRSYRPGIKLYADSLQTILQERQATNALERNDSIEFWAHWHKLWADWFYEDGNYNETSFVLSEKHFNEALRIFRLAKGNVFETKVSAVPIVHQELAQLCYRLKRYEEALQYTQKAYGVYDLAINDNGEYEQGDEEYNTYLDLKSQLAISNARLGNTDLALKQITALQNEFSKGTEKYYEALRKKGKILMLGGKAGCTRQALTLYREYLHFRKSNALTVLATMTADERQDYWMRLRPFVADCYQLENADPAFLYDVTLFAKGLLLQLNRLSGRGQASEEALASLKHNWRQIQAKLTKDACAIEFVQYEKGGEQKMAALVLKKNGTPQWVEMMSPKDFLGYENKLYGKTNEERLYADNMPIGDLKKMKNGLYNDSTLYSLIWNKQICTLVKDCRKVYFAPDGHLHQIAIEYMVPAEMKTAQFYRLTSTRRLLDDGHLRNDAALIAGGMNYAIAAPSDRTTGINDQTAYNNLRNLPDRFGQLKNSLQECDSIAKIRSCQQDTLLRGCAATEAAFRAMCNQYPIINISTHGLFCSAVVPQGTAIKPCLTDESLSQSLLAMAGVNSALDNEQFDPAEYDGILSAYEMATLDMSNVDLVVISACQTGIGYVTSDGVFGIQRGLKNAGVGSIIASLWSVSDNATCQLMTRLHQKLRRGLPLHEAFMQARAILMQENNQTTASQTTFNAIRLTRTTQQTNGESYNEPYYYNAFILIDAIN